MRVLRAALDRQARHFEKGGKLEKFYPLWEAIDTFFYTPASVTRTGAHVRDALDLKRMMILVVVAAIPCALMAMYNTGLQANLALDPAKTAALDGWRHELIRLLGVGYSPASALANFVHGALYFLPLYIVTMAVGLAWEVTFSIVRRLEVNEGFFVTGILYVLILPPTTPLWQAALGISFGVVLAKEVFGGTGMNFINPALAARAFLFFAYPAEISGDKVWTAVPEGAAVDGFSGATLLAQMRVMTGSFEDAGFSWWNAFVGLEPGSMGETSALACLAGAVLLLVTKIASWRTMAGVALGTIATALVFNAIGSATNPWFGVPFWWHMVLGGWAFGTVFMATDPVTSPFSESGKWVYGVLIGTLVVLIRIVNPAYPESMMLVILFMNVMAPVIDHGFVRADVRRRLARHG
ncbi:NADH:ubiquinone reductase (Na(+)-transporting) subunit B [Betaproteobacteria bacterium PRO7]|jgi:Na+-transporting NADH:ubiquinone oxidoreductase subunit B|nr:NADH:ubiquinone reductase (Na(+)-transporting) subunit B [Betaproteobacteria bacterium PRO7]